MTPGAAMSGSKNVWSKIIGDDVVVETKQGLLRGSVRRVNRDGVLAVYRFRGIPYAAPPVGEARFKKPRPPQSWPEGVVKDCRRFGNIAPQALDTVFMHVLPRTMAATLDGCLYLLGINPKANTNPQRPHLLQMKSAEDNCLNLNIETPSLTGRLPVMVWVHGGGFLFGAGSQHVYHHRASVVARKGVVLVTLNYRLGVLGFLKVEGGDYNCGLWDQVAALQWVKENISNFGGDPDNVTVFGESAGGMSTAVLSASPFAGQLFHKVIIQSCSTHGWSLSRDEAEYLSQQAAKVLKLSSCSTQNMQHYSAKQLLALQRAMLKGARLGPMPFLPVVDGDLLPQDVIDIWRSGHTASRLKSVMIGYARDEELFICRMFKEAHIQPFECKSEKELLTLVSSCYSRLGLSDPEGSACKTVEELKNLHTPQVAGMSLWTTKACALQTLLKFSLPTYISAQALSEGGVHNLYMYRIDVRSLSLGGACHAIDLPYIFGTYLDWGPMCQLDPRANYRLSKSIIRAWTAFSTAGDPSFNRPSDAELEAASRDAGRATAMNTEGDDEEEEDEECKADPPISPTNQQATNSQQQQEAPPTSSCFGRSNSFSFKPRVKQPSTSYLPSWPLAVPAEAPKTGTAKTVMVIDLPLTHCRVEQTDLLAAMPETTKLVAAANRGLWFPRPPLDDDSGMMKKQPQTKASKRAELRTPTTTTTTTTTHSPLSSPCPSVGTLATKSSSLSGSGSSVYATAMSFKHVPETSVEA